MAERLKLQLVVTVVYNCTAKPIPDMRLPGELDLAKAIKTEKKKLADNLTRMVQAAHADDSLIHGAPVDVEQVQFTVAEVL